jgi:hypothetical protein
MQMKQFIKDSDLIRSTNFFFKIHGLGMNDASLLEGLIIAGFVMFMGYFVIPKTAQLNSNFFCSEI